MKLKSWAIIIACIMCVALGYYTAWSPQSNRDVEFNDSLQVRVDSIRAAMQGEMQRVEDSLKQHYCVDTLWRRRTVTRVESVSVAIDSQYRDSSHVPIEVVSTLIATAHDAKLACDATISTCETRVKHAEDQRDAALVLAATESTRVVEARDSTQAANKRAQREKKKGQLAILIGLIIALWK